MAPGKVELRALELGFGGILAGCTEVCVGCWLSTNVSGQTGESEFRGLPGLPERRGVQPLPPVPGRRIQEPPASEDGGVEGGGEARGVKKRSLRELFLVFFLKASWSFFWIVRVPRAWDICMIILIIFKYFQYTYIYIYISP